jgi:hypothetical protein
MCFVAACIFVQVCACSRPPQVRATLDQVLADPETYEDTELIITAPISDVLENSFRYQDYRIEVTGELGYYGSLSFWTWYLMVADEEGKQLRCYTKHYRTSVGRDAGVVLKRASMEKKPITVNGYLEKDGLSIREILYGGALVKPSKKPRYSH